MITPVSLVDYKNTVLELIEELDADCEECDGTGVCPCCERECQECDGFGTKGKELSDCDIHAMYFQAVMLSLKKLCAYSSRHDFLTEAGDFIKTNGRPDMRSAWLKHYQFGAAPFIDISQPNINTVH
ncbi:hypothetical protein [Vreelandella nanhaiensis]|uniref:Uncharacterized protein n=1 Tax=Vreelandella nanhaiensis TaxID=1258546 RepID=A0A3S0WPE3_9GAMM|nr:hypothetical protein [Halomonas nanhaiensis]RUR34505.1 hypothetical protein ELY38_02630 [Halomonas nanhaiensis]